MVFDYDIARSRMVREQLIDRGITDERVLRVMKTLPRHLFLDQAFWPRAYGDHSLPIGCDQTMSQPYMVGLMTQTLELSGGETVLEIGTGSGYQAAVLALMGCTVITMERIDDLSDRARKVVSSLKVRGITFMVGDGSCGWPDAAPYDRIIVTAGAPAVPEALVGQLAPQGRLVIPVGTQHSQRLIRIVKNGAMIEKSEICGCTFVPLLGKQAWKHE